MTKVGLLHLTENVHPRRVSEGLLRVEQRLGDVKRTRVDVAKQSGVTVLAEVGTDVMSGDQRGAEKLERWSVFS